MALHVELNPRKTRRTLLVDGCFNSEKEHYALRCAVRSSRLGKAFQLLHVNRTLKEDCLFDNREIRACQTIRCSWAWLW